MTKDDIIRMAGEVDAVTKILLDRKAPQGMDHDVFVCFLERFAALVRADERKAAAKDWEAKHGYDKHGVAAAIRARGNT